MQAVLSIMRKHRSGTIVNVSSMGGRIAFPLSSTYSGTKFGLEGLTESLSYEVEQFGIKVILIEPGVVLHTITHIEGMEENRIQPNVFNWESGLYDPSSYSANLDDVYIYITLL